MSAAPDDAAVLAGLASASREARAELAAAVAAVEEASGPLVEWRGGERQAGGAITMPWAAYAEPVSALLGALGRAGAVPVFDWMRWDGARRYRTAGDVAAAPLADVARLVTTIVRGDRFAEGTVAAALEDGRLLAAARRVRDGR
ncbi:DUF6508 domain-containing protein [Geodermatophilus nigrescens]|uniref:Uncharacterized protein n=1 Tax=Geodermatophilus nigrescens TaxID=1070870 RepID=A0A1M5MAI5_9ACTN|nr:DUF6508 domain-containing protein [Geodermatophilus nigrescens]SHG73703.1 hypothetical protein SAMN05444351_3079 [Geodermatophilus nigrescens]